VHKVGYYNSQFKHVGSQQFPDPLKVKPVKHTKHLFNPVEEQTQHSLSSQSRQAPELKTYFPAQD
jgi:hypothetical protein